MSTDVFMVQAGTQDVICFIYVLKTPSQSYRSIAVDNKIYFH